MVGPTCLLCRLHAQSAGMQRKQRLAWRLLLVLQPHLEVFGEQQLKTFGLKLRAGMLLFLHHAKCIGFASAEERASVVLLAMHRAWRDRPSLQTLVLRAAAAAATRPIPWEVDLGWPTAYLPVQTPLAAPLSCILWEAMHGSVARY